MRLEIRQECVGSSLRVSRACQDGAREFAGRRPRLTEKLSGVAEILAGSWDGLVMDVLFARRFAKGIRKLAGNTKGDCREEDQMTYRKNAGGYRIMREIWVAGSTFWQVNCPKWWVNRPYHRILAAASG
ncbi:hypothetical protein BHE74_00042276 [Ensete ventricosum]|nr:hypothetical protein GW17_00048605 [Ensete ventricosum]RWW51383.1 hypothetical protein BHE74_00042276 [Ensete ventricosum]